MATSFLNTPKVLKDINEENKIIVDELDFILGNDICKNIQYSKIYELSIK